jgi:hypothetical protein
MEYLLAHFPRSSPLHDRIRAGIRASDEARSLS